MNTAKKTRNRNPASPSLDLGDSIDKAEVLHRKEAHKPMMPETAAKHWGSSITSSVAQQAISSLKQYGLLIDEKVGGMRKLRLSDLALKILLDKRSDSTERIESLREAALTPKIHAELWDMAEDSLLPSDEEMEHYLTLGRKQRFYLDIVKRVIEIYKSSVSVAELEYRDIMDKGEHEDDDTPPPKVGVGNYVQWVSQGQQKFKEPKKVTGLSEDGVWAFVEGSETGLLVSELTIDTNKKPDKPVVPPVNPGYVTIPPEQGTREFPLYLSGGQRAFLRIPEKMTVADFELLKTQISSSLSVTEATTTFLDAHYFSATPGDTKNPDS